MFLERGFEFTHEAVRDWEARFAPVITQQLRARRTGKAGKAGSSWHADETYVKVGGKWCYLYRAVDRNGNLADSMLSEHRELETAKRFIKGPREVVGHKPEKVTTDGHDPHPRAIRRVLGRKMEHRTSSLALIELPYYRMQQAPRGYPRGIKQRYYPMRGFGSFEPASQFCSTFDEQRDYFRYRVKPRKGAFGQTATDSPASIWCSTTPDDASITACTCTGSGSPSVCLAPLKRIKPKRVWSV